MVTALWSVSEPERAGRPRQADTAPGTRRGSSGAINVPPRNNKLELLPFLTKEPKAFSGGQRQRVALARASARRPRLAHRALHQASRASDAAAVAAAVGQDDPRGLGRLENRLVQSHLHGAATPVAQGGRERGGHSDQG